MKNSVLTCLAILVIQASSHAAYYINDDYSTFLTGDLVGQNGWAQQGAESTNPVQISGGLLTLAAGGGSGSSNDQDVIKSFSFTSSPGTTIFFGLRMQTTSPGANSDGFNSSYVGGLFDGSFVDTRIAQLNIDGDFYQYSARVNGQGSNPYSQTPNFYQFGSDFQNVIASFTYADGATPDRLQLWIDPASTAAPADLSLDNMGTPVGTDFNGFVLSQFSFSHEVNISNLVVADTFAETLDVLAIPEPSVFALVVGAIVVSGFVCRARRQRA